MVPVKLQLRNFMSYRSPEVIDFSGFDLAILNGDNGAGKSTLLEAITWALWGKSRASSDDNLIHKGETSMWVELIFDYEGNRYRVVRTRDLKGRGLSTLEFQVAENHQTGQATLEGGYARSWKPLTGPTMKQTQEMIVKTLKLDYDLFVNSSFLRQGHADEFTVKIPAERKEILADILDLSLYDQLEEKAKEKKRELEGRRQLLSAQIEDLRERAAVKAEVESEYQRKVMAKEKLEKELFAKETALKRLESVRRRFEAMEKERELLRTRYEEMTREILELETAQREEKQAIRNAEGLIKDKGAIEKDFRTLRKLREDYEELNQKFTRAAAVRQELSVIAHREQELQQVINRLKHITVCPTCLRSMSKKEAGVIIEKLKKQFTAELGPQRVRLEKELQAIGFDQDRLNKVREGLSKLGAAEGRMRELAVAESALSKASKILTSLRENEERLVRHRKKIGTRGKELSKEIALLTEKRAEWEALEDGRVVLQKELETIQASVGGLKDRLEQIRLLENQVRQKEDELKRITADVAIYNDLALAFGKKGVQAMIIEQTIPQIEEGANFLLQKITGGRLQVRFVTQKAKKTAEEEKIETLDIEISDELGARPYEQYSGGEAFRINFAIRVALAKLLALRAGAKLQFLVIDEGFGMLDSSGREDIVAAITSIKEDFAKIIVVTHIEEFKNLFPTRIEVTKDSAGSHVQIFAQ